MSTNFTSSSAINFTISETLENAMVAPKRVICAVISTSQVYARHRVDRDKTCALLLKYNVYGTFSRIIYHTLEFSHGAGGKKYGFFGAALAKVCYIISGACILSN